MARFSLGRNAMLWIDAMLILLAYGLVRGIEWARESGE